MVCYIFIILREACVNQTRTVVGKRDPYVTDANSSLRVMLYQWVRGSAGGRREGKSLSHWRDTVPGEGWHLSWSSEDLSNVEEDGELPTKIIDYAKDGCGGRRRRKGNVKRTIKDPDLDFILWYLFTWWEA